MHKGMAHNRIRNSLHLILEEVGPLLGLCFSQEDVRLEARNLSPRFLRWRPADVAAAMRQHHRSGHRRSPFHTYGTDVNLLKFRPLTHCDDFDTEIAQAMSRHTVRGVEEAKGADAIRLLPSTEGGRRRICGQLLEQQCDVVCIYGVFLEIGWSAREGAVVQRPTPGSTKRFLGDEAERGAGI